MFYYRKYFIFIVRTVDNFTLILMLLHVHVEKFILEKCILQFLILTKLCGCMVEMNKKYKFYVLY